MVRLWWLWWPQPARPPPQRWRQAAEHSEAPPRVAPPQPHTHGAAVVVVPTSDRHHHGGGSVVAVVRVLIGKGEGCRRLCRRGGGVHSWWEWSVVASNEDDIEGSGGGRERTETASHVRCAVCAAAMNEWGDEDTAVGGGEA
ncbi:hypothetical protein Tco_0172693 [Tanacetum coccineum]